MSGTPRPSIGEHGAIGDLRTAALVGNEGTIDWFCPGRFDAPSVFAALLDPERGGCWRMHPTCEVSATHQFHFPDTNVLITRFLTEDGVVEVQDFMPVAADEAGHRQRLVRRVVAVRGKMGLSTCVSPRFDYGRAEHETTQADGAGIRFTSGDLTLALDASVPLTREAGDATASFGLTEGEHATFVLEVVPEGEDPLDGPDAQDATALFDATVRFWRDWLAQSTYTGRWREMVHRSALTLKLLSHQPTGGIVAALTTSLPEVPGGGRNWDYRYVWMRDAAFSVYALLRLGFTEEARSFVHWLTERFREHDADGLTADAGPLQVMYDLDGGRELPETELDHLRGYAGSRPVRVGNGAAGQLQLDIYGEIIDSVYLADKEQPIAHETWRDLSRVIEWLCEHWDAPDEGIWESRGGRRDHTFSRLMCWVAFERMIRMARRRGLPADLGRWMGERDAIYDQIMERGWSGERGAFVQRYDSDVLDASLLLMPMVKFVAPTDPRFLSTLDAIGANLVSDTLVHRYDAGASPDGLDGTEGTFSMCSFWYVEALTRAGRLDEARLALEKMFTYANHLGLYAEEVGLTGDQLGNFPQAFTHLALISAAINLDRALG